MQIKIYNFQKVQNAQGQAFSGFSTEDCIPIKGNFVRVPVIWSVGGAYNSDLRKVSIFSYLFSFIFILFLSVCLVREKEEEKGEI